MKILRNIALLITLAGCSNPEYIEIVSYYPDSQQPRMIMVYDSQSDTVKGDFLLKECSQNGKIAGSIEFQNNLRQGIFRTYFPNGNIESEGHYDKDVLNGVVRWYNEERFLMNEQLYLRGRQKTVKQFTGTVLMDSNKVVYDTVYGYDIFRINFDSTETQEGNIHFDKSMKVCDSLSYYYRVNSKDTIKGSDTLYFAVDLIMSSPIDQYFELGKVTLYIGELNDDFSLTDTIGQYIIDSPSQQCNGKYWTSQKGYQIITGLIYINMHNMSDSLDNRCSEFIFYHQFYVE